MSRSGNFRLPLDLFTKRMTAVQTRSAFWCTSISLRELYLANNANHKAFHPHHTPFRSIQMATSSQRPYCTHSLSSVPHSVDGLTKYAVIRKNLAIHFAIHSQYQISFQYIEYFGVNPLNAELKPICHLLALLGAHHILLVSRIRVKYACVLFKDVYSEHLKWYLG